MGAFWTDAPFRYQWIGQKYFGFEAVTAVENFRHYIKGADFPVQDLTERARLH